MNYRTIQGREGELLLSDSRTKAEEFRNETPSQRSDVISKTLKSEKEKLIDNTESDNTTSPEYLKRTSEQTTPRDSNQNTSHITRDVNQGLNSTSWVSFDESSNTNSDGLEPKQSPTALTDNGNSGILPSEGDWVKFEGTKGNNGLNSKDNNISKDTKDNCTQLESASETQSQDVSTNPFSNSELDRISSFSKSPKTINGVSLAKPIKPPSFVQEAHGIGIKSTKENHAVINSVDGAPCRESTEDTPSTPLPAYPIKSTNKTWPMLLRYPDTKRRIRGREWRPVVLKLNGSILQVYDEHDTSAPFREVSLQCFYDLTKPQLQYHHDNKLHTVKVLYVKYKETQRLISKKNVQYIAKTTPILKLASSSHTVIREFIEAVRHAIRSLPIFRDRGISHNTEAVYINVNDTCSALIDATGSVIMLGILVRIYLRAFISGIAECELVLNDIHMKTQELARLQEELMPQRVHKWIKLEECDFHSTVNSSKYYQDCCIMLHPIDSCTFEVMQFRVRPVKPLPLLAKCELITEGHGRVELRGEVKLCSDTKLAKYERKNICLYFPIPDAWACLFMKEKRFGGEKSITSTNSQKAIKLRNQKNRPLTTIEVSTGSAKYEPEYKCIVWRINQLPLLNTTAPADSTHDFTCHIQTMDSAHLPDDYKPQCMMEYEVPYTVASDTNVVNFKVLDKKLATREVSYHTYYTYEIEMNMTSLNGGLHYDR